MNTDPDFRDYEKDVKRLAKDFRRVLHLALDTTNIEATKLFDEQFRADVQAIVRELSYGYESVNSIGLHRSLKKPSYAEQAFFLFHEALNLVFVALRTVRGGSVIAGDGILRQALELACVAYQIASDKSAKKLDEFLAGRLHAPGAISVAKNIYAPIGRLYGILSNSAVHASTEHIRNSISMNPELDTSGRINIGASFAPSQGHRFQLGLIRIERVAVAILALIESGLADYVEEPHVWRKTSLGLEWSNEPYIEKRLKQADVEQKAIEQPYLTVYPWVDVSDREEVRQLLGTVEGMAIADVERLKGISQKHPKSFVAHYLLGAALYDAGNFGDAASEFEQAWSLRHDGYDVWSRLEAIYKGVPNPRVLEEFYQRSLERNANDYVAIHNLGKLYESMNRLEKAFECFQRAHKLKPERYHAVYNAANTLLRLGRYDKAIDCYRHAGNSTGIILTRGIVLALHTCGPITFAAHTNRSAMRCNWILVTSLPGPTLRASVGN